MPQRLGLIKTAAWGTVNETCRAALDEVTTSLSGAGVQIMTSSNLEELVSIEHDLETAYVLTREIQAYEQRWPLNTYRAHDPIGLSQLMVDRLEKSQTLSIEDYEQMLQRREDVRRKHGRLSEKVDAIITLSAPGIAPKGIRSSGDP